MIPQVELDELRAVVLESLPDTAIILERVEVPDGSGGTIVTWSPRPGDVPARVTSGTVRAIEGGAGGGGSDGKVVSRMYYQIQLPHGTPLGPEDRISVEGVIYEVIGHGDFRSESMVMTVQVEVVDSLTPFTPP